MLAPAAAAERDRALGGAHEGEPRFERGLHFACFNASIARQFEVVQDWCVDGNVFGPGLTYKLQWATSRSNGESTCGRIFWVSASAFLRFPLCAMAKAPNGVLAMNGWMFSARSMVTVE